MMLFIKAYLLIGFTFAMIVVISAYANGLVNVVNGRTIIEGIVRVVLITLLYPIVIIDLYINR